MELSPLHEMSKPVFSLCVCVCGGGGGGGCVNEKKYFNMSPAENFTQTGKC